MPFTMPSFPILTSEQANPMLYGAQIGQKMTANALMLPQQLLAAQLKNQYYPANILSEIALRQAQGGLAQAQTGLLAPQTMIEQIKANLMAGRPATMGIGSSGAPATSNAPSMNQAITNQLSPIDQQNAAFSNNASSSMGDSSSSTDMITGGNMPSSTQSVYGVDLPSMSNDDIRNKALGFDSFTPRYHQALDNVQIQRNLYNNQVTKSGAQANSGLDFLNKFNLYNNLMDETFEKGVPLGYTPGFLNVPKAQQIDNLTSQMVVPAVASLHEVLGEGRVNIPQFTAALATKPNRSWSKSTRDLYLQGLTTGINRDTQESQFYNYLQQNPNLGVTKQQADILWANFKKHNPIVSADGTKFLPQNAQGQNWMAYTTPDAIQAIKTKGDYVPSENNINTNPVATALANLPSTQKEGIANVDLTNPSNKNTTQRSGFVWKTPPTAADIAATAKKYRMSSAQVKNYLGL